ncbi:MAG: DUF971 domain-containing protein [Bryobacterales bacterium]|nr:DUF971 domain-containing protein [Bryobacterales bacterium]
MNPTSFDPEHIAISKSKGIKIDWKDGHHSDLALAVLRDECPCAGCTGAHGTPPERTNHSQPAKEAFPMFKPMLKMLDIQPVGGYALRIYWNDGHNAGIYSYEHLRGICPCAECAAARTAGQGS